MSTNSHHASYKGIRKDFNYGSNRREFLSENGLEPQTANFSGNPTRNSPLASMNQKDLPRDLFEKNSPSKEYIEQLILTRSRQRTFKSQRPTESAAKNVSTGERRNCDTSPANYK